MAGTAVGRVLPTLILYTVLKFISLLCILAAVLKGAGIFLKSFAKVLPLNGKERGPGNNKVFYLKALKPVLIR